MDTVFALALQVDDQATRNTWTKYTEVAIAKRGGFNRLVADLNACLEGSKILDYSPDGVPAFIQVEVK